MSPYSTTDSLRVRRCAGTVIVEFFAEVEDSGWEEGEGWMASLLPLRADLLRGDLRCLYLGWLCGVQAEEIDDEEGKPSVPAGLGSLSAPLDALADFLDLDQSLVEVAAENSASDPAPPTDTELAEWLGRLPESDKDELLIRVASGRNADIAAEVLRRFRLQSSGNAKPAAPPRTVAELLDTADARAEQALQRAAEEHAARQAKEKREQAEVRTRYLDHLAGKEPALWEKVQTLIQTRRPNDCDRAVTTLIELRDLADRSNQEHQFQSSLVHLRATHRSKPSFLNRLADAGL